mgnify:CR=1 FL=1
MYNEIFNNIKNEFIIGDLPQAKRLKIMDSFKSGKIKCLIATDVAARGIDVNDLQMVVNYDLPNEAENYVHRIGRTARAGKSGKAYTFCSEQDVYSLLPIERYIEKQIPSKVATEEDYGQDKSQGVYIRLGSEKGNKKTSKERSKQNYKTIIIQFSKIRWKLWIYKWFKIYFKPKFMLGLTATPERLDAKDIFALCDYNTVYEIRLKEAINKSIKDFK